MSEFQNRLIKKLELINYKGFQRFTVRFGGSAFLVGPNNAGKSTIIQALRGCAHMIDHALAKSPVIYRRDGKKWIRAYAFTKNDFSLVTENVRHEFSPTEARIELTFDNGSILRVVWPKLGDEGEDQPFFYLEGNNGKQPTRPKEVALYFGRIGVIPTLTPIEASEDVLREDYVRQSVDTKLASRHFRNQIFLLDRPGFDEERKKYFNFVAKWTPEITITELRARLGDRGRELDLFYRERFSRTDKEIYWAGDGLQIWFQFLLHIHRLQKESIIVLDEPDVYLHADLQRRLVRVLEDSRAQAITATHSAEILGEAAANLIVLVDRSRRQSLLAPQGDHLLALSDALGSQFNLRLARVLRARVVVFVEGKDQKLLRYIARSVGAVKFATEEQVAVVPIDGFSNWDRIIPFKLIIDDLLEKSVHVFAILDRDYRTDEEIGEVTRELLQSGVQAVIWTRKELESYLLDPKIISRLAKKGTTTDWIIQVMDKATEGLKDEILASFLSSRKGRCIKRKEQPPKDKDLVKEFRNLWMSSMGRARLCPPKDVLAAINIALQDEGRGTMSFDSIARAMTVDEVPTEVREVLSRIELAIDKRS